MKNAGQSMVMGIQSIDIGVLGGVLIGIIVAKIHDKFHEIKLPDALAFFWRFKICSNSDFRYSGSY